MCHWSSGNECNWIVELLCGVMEWIIHTEQDKFHRKQISIAQYNYSIKFINPSSIQVLHKGEFELCGYDSNLPTQSDYMAN